ncbi:MAG: 1-deoxy-D-xylulose-5-phosphate reductoisomerase, partial [Chloroflexi bacterium]|nr:1-deoxy-D-xylulose-5-phosphate reductoisomerase [Chloroflexota bacterium]
MGGTVKRIAVLGSTGSIGIQTLDVVRAWKGRFSVVGLAAGRNTALLSKQVAEFRPKLVHCQNGDPSALPEGSHQFVTLDEVAAHEDVDLVVVATSGKAGLAPTLAAIRAGKQIALANKEVLVMAGGIIMAEAERCGVEVRPVDSEHSAIWQCLQGENRQNVARLVLTASGGPFLHHTLEGMAAITPEQALRHPTWQMGEKVTVDCATLMNKGMEMIEAHWLFGLPLDRIRVLIHQGSIVHSMVEFTDGSVKAQLGMPDMRLPIQYALAYPERLPGPSLPKVDWDRFPALNFAAPDLFKFPCLKLAIQAGGNGGTYPAVLCAADEVAVGLFLSHVIGYLDIAGLVADTLERHQSREHPSLEEILA